MKRLGRTTSGVLANLAAQGFPFLLLIFVTPILLQSLGREVYGALILFNLVPQIAGQLDLGMVTAGTRAYAQFSARGDHTGARRAVRETLAILCAWGTLLGLALYFSRDAIADGLRLVDVTRDDQAVFVVAAFSVPLALINGAALIPLRAVEQYGLAARIQIAGGIVYWTLCAIGASHGATLTQLVVLGTVIVAITTVALFATARRYTSSGGSPAPIQTGSPPDTGAAAERDRLAPPTASGAFRLRPFLGLGAGTFVAQASSLATYHADKLLISAMISPAAAGAYAICANIANKILQVVMSGATYTFPRVTNLHSVGDVEAVTRTFVTATRFALMIAVALAVPLIALAPGFLRIWIDAEFARSYALALQLLVAGYAINASSVVASNVAIGIGEVRMPAIFAMLGGVVTVIALIVLAPLFGATGAALAAAIGMSQALIFNHLIARKLGPAARATSWPLVLRLLIVALPVCVLAAAASDVVEGWIALIGLGGAASLLFLGAWIASFGRCEERLLLTDLVRRARNQTTG